MEKCPRRGCLRQISNHLQINSKEVAEFIRDEASELTATDAMRMMAQMNVEKKTMMALMMSEMVYADGSTDPNELDILTSVLAAMFSVGPAQE